MSTIPKIFKKKTKGKHNFSQNTFMSVKCSVNFHYSCRGDGFRTCVSVWKIQEDKVFRVLDNKNKGKR